MIYVLFGENENGIDKFINELVNELGIDSYVTYDYSECTILDVIEELSYFDLFGNKKLVVLKDAHFLTSKSTLESIEFDNYLSNPNKDAVLVLKIVSDKLDERKKIVKSLREKATFKEFKLLDSKDIEGYIKEYFNDKGYKINNDAIIEISNRLKSNTKVIDSELSKLALYKKDDKSINIKDVKNVICVYEENIMFSLVDAALKKNKKEIFRLYKTLTQNKEEPTVILVMIANQFRLMYQVKILTKEGLDKFKVANILKEHHYRVGLAIQNSLNISEEELIKILYKLSIIDEQIKTGVMDKMKALEMFFLEL